MKTVWKGEWSAAVAKATTGYTVTVAKNYIWVATFVAMRDDSCRVWAHQVERAFAAGEAHS